MTSNRGGQHETRAGNGFRGAIIFSVLGLGAALLLGGPQTVVIVAMLGLLEIVLSFDNAVVNATVLVRLGPFWQRMFLTVGVLIAVVGVRMLFPLAIVAATAHLSPVHAVRLALDQPHAYERVLMAAQPRIAAFGGVFLLMIFLNFLSKERDITWLRAIERPFARAGRMPQLPTIVTLALLLIGALTFARHEARMELFAGGIGVVGYLVVDGIGGMFEAWGDTHAPGTDAARPHGRVHLTGKAAFVTFCYLELLDASFSFDSVLGAFSVSTDIIQITLGLAIGVVFFRSLTVYIVRNDTLDDYVYLEHGAHYAIGALAVLLLVEIDRDVPDIVTGLSGTLIIAAAFLSSVFHNRRDAGGHEERKTSEHTAVSAGTR